MFANTYIKHHEHHYFPAGTFRLEIWCMCHTTLVYVPHIIGICTSQHWNMYLTTSHIVGPHSSLHRFRTESVCPILLLPLKIYMKAGFCACAWMAFVHPNNLGDFGISGTQSLPMTRTEQGYATLFNQPGLSTGTSLWSFTNYWTEPGLSTNFELYASLLRMMRWEAYNANPTMPSALTGGYTSQAGYDPYSIDWYTWAGGNGAKGGSGDLRVLSANCSAVPILACFIKQDLAISSIYTNGGSSN